VFGLPLLWPGLYRLKVSVKEQGDKLALFIGSSMATQTDQHYYNSILHNYVRPHLEYAVPLWDPHQQGHTNSLEKVQKFALKVCTGSGIWTTTAFWTPLTRVGNLQALLKAIILISGHSWQLYFSQCTTWETFNSFPQTREVLHPHFYYKDREPTLMSTSTPFFPML